MRDELRMKYKQELAKKLGNRLDKISDEKLERIVKIIDSKVAQFETNDKLSDSKKEKIIAIYEALKELIEERLGKISED